MDKKRILSGQFTMRLALILLCATAFTTAMLSGLYARYLTKSSGQDSARVALMAGDATYTLSDLYAAPGEENRIRFTITNTEGGSVCEVAQTYRVKVINLTKNLPLAFTYFKVDGGEQTKIDKIQGVFHAGESQSVTYEVQILWESPQPATQAFEMDALQVIIETEQID